MHDAYDLSQLLKLTVQIEAIAAYEDNLLVGTKQGHLLLYNVSRRPGEIKHEVQLLNYNKTFSKKAIQQLDIVTKLQLLISLSDYVISVHDLHSFKFQPLATLHRTKGAHLFALDNSDHLSLTQKPSVTIFLCAAVKRKLQFYYYKEGQFLELYKDKTLPDVPRCIAWAGTTLCIGFKSEYTLLDLKKDVETFIQLFPIGKAPEPIAVKTSDNTFAVSKDNQCVLIDNEGVLSHKYVVKWADFPVSVVYDEPYLIALLPESLQVRTLEPNLYIQSLPVTRPRFVSHARLGLCYIASQNLVYCLQAVPVPQQLKSLIQEKQFQLAIKLVNISDDNPEDKARNAYDIQTLYAFHLFYSKQFHESMAQFLKLETDPYEVIKLYPELLPAGARPSSNTTHSPTTQTKLTEKETETGILALIEYLTQVRFKFPSFTKNEWNRYKSVNTLLSIIDTTMLKCYVQTNDVLIAPLLRLNCCHLVESEQVLMKHNKTSELIVLYQTKQRHDKALALLKQQLDGHERVVQYLQHLGSEEMELILKYADWVIENHPEDGLKIFIEDTIEIEQWPKPRILDHLLTHHSALVIPYLEHVIHTCKDTNSIFHDALVNQYRDKWQQLTANSDTRQEGMLVREKLIYFLEHSLHYKPGAVLRFFPTDCMFEERALILGRLGRHEQALSIYVCILGDVQRAKHYCDRVYQETGPSRDVYMLLMRVLVCPPDNWLVDVDKQPRVSSQSDMNTAVEILLAYSDKINPVLALSILPDTVSLKLIKSFLITSLKLRVSDRRNTQIMKGLLYAENLQVQQERVKNESQCVLISENNTCLVCKKRFTNQSAFARYPTGEIVHFSCQNERGRNNVGIR